MMTGFGIGAGDSIVYASGSFANAKLRLLRGYRVSQNTKVTTGFDGTSGFVTCRIDTAKLPASWNGAMQECWVFQPRGECTTIGTLATNDPNVPYTGRPAAYLYDLSFRVAVFGVPLYFCYEDQAEALMDVLLPRLMQGLTP